MKKTILASVALFVFLSLCACGSPTTPASSSENLPNGNSSSERETVSEFEYGSIDQYITYRLPDTLADGGYNRDLGYLGGNLFCLKATGSSVAKEASEGTPPGWNSYGGAEIYYNLQCQFDHGQLVDVSQPWNHAVFLTKTEPVENCAAPAAIVQVSFDLYTAAEAEENHIAQEKQNSTMWYVFFAKKDSEISYAVFLNADHYGKEDAVSLAQSVKFSDQAFRFAVK